MYQVIIVDGYRHELLGHTATIKEAMDTMLAFRHFVAGIGFAVLNPDGTLNVMVAGSQAVR